MASLGRLAWLLALAAAAVAQPPRPLVAQLDLRDETRRLAHLVVDSDSDRLYVAGVNRLLELSADLQVTARAVTGPVADAPDCPASGCPPAVDAQPTDNVNKLLLPVEGRLLSCGSVRQGACRLHQRANISRSQFVDVEVAANDEHASTVGFVGPERYHPWSGSQVLYVGTTFTNVGPYRHSVPAIASRRLPGLELAEYSFSQQSLLRIDVKYRDHFLVQYKAGFAAGDHVYFVAVQKKSHLPGQDEVGYISRIARVCVTDPNYNSYTEVTVECGAYNLVRSARLTSAGADLAAAAGVKTGDPVLVAVFSPSDGNTMVYQNKSAVCVFPLAEVDYKFNENIHMCFNGTMRYRNMDYISGKILDGKCPETRSAGRNIPDFCEVGLKISGVSPLMGTPALELPTTGLTGLALATTSSHTVAFLGTNNGSVIKALVVSPELGRQYESIPVDPGSPIGADLRMAPGGDFVYVLSTQKVSKVRVQTCEMYTDCTACLGSGDPYCGWCSLEKRCTIRSECQKAQQSSPRWLTFGAGQQCIDFEQVLPDRIPVDQTVTVQLTIRTLPALPPGAKYQCVFGETAPSDALVTASGLSCRTPPPALRPAVPAGADHVAVPLSVRSSETNKDFVSRQFSYYDCSRHATCAACASSAWACNWCVYDNVCTHNATVCRRTVVSGEHNPSPLVTHGGAFCPRFKPSPTPILLANGRRSEVAVQAENLPRPEPGGAAVFHCIVEIEGAKMRVPARVERGERVICEKTSYSYQAAESELTARLTVVWDGDRLVDATNVTLYKCGVLGSHRGHADCSLCVTRPSRYECAWCGDACSHRADCGQGAALECPKPRIDLIYPLSGPVEGGTLLTIEGSNLGRRAADVRDRILVGDVPCALVEYQVSVRIVCRTGATAHPMNVAVAVGNHAGFAESAVKYSYHDIQLFDVHPRTGPESGGTRLTLSGGHLTVGSRVRVWLDHLPCAVTQGPGQLSCVTAPSDGTRSVRTLTLQIDAANRTLVGNPFNYTSDPSVLEIKPLRSPESGGRLIMVHGTNLDSIQEPQMTVFLDDQQKVLNATVCRVLSSSQMQCPSPPVDPRAVRGAGWRREIRGKPSKYARSPRPPHDDVLSLNIGFIMDSVAGVRNLKQHSALMRSTLLYVQDPVVMPFPGRVKLYKGDTLVIEGQNLNLAADESDMRVLIGTHSCNVTSLALSQLVCTPPAVQPPGTDDLGRPTPEQVPLVVVRVGENLRFPLGLLRYEMIKPYTFPPEVVGGIAVSGVILVLLSVVILAVYRRKSTQAEREYKRIQIQMDTLESNVRMECKQAFAELQTDITDLTADLESTGIPIFDHRTFVMKVFFPGVTDHPILADPKLRVNGTRTNFDTAMVQFEQLINNRYFLLTFIEVLESQKSFSIRDKVNVASLLMVILMSKMEYATEILRLLLLRLIDKSISSKYPQLMLRRTESVVEKFLTNWMALCLYEHLRSDSAASLFLLTAAIKHQVEKGPVDALTHDARYSLSEERLLREQIPHSTVTIHLVQEDPHYEKIPYQMYQTLQIAPEELEEKVQCRVLDCDTINQVKSKILDALYKNTPHTLRPSIHEVDLEWRHGRGGHLTLADEDLTSKMVDGWRRLNTLAHYGVKDSAVMSLVPRQASQVSPATRSPYSSVYSIPTSVSPSQNGTLRKVNMYHLVRPACEYASQRSERSHKAIPEIFLTRLLSTKGTIQKFVDDLLTTILDAGETLPPAIKWLFDLFDEAARVHAVPNGEEVTYAWKSNSLPLRFWVNFIKNPDFLFDIDKSVTVDSCLTVIAQTFMDACSTSEHRLGKDSPSNKLLFAKDLPHYRSQVERFYRDVNELPTVTDQELNSHMQRLSVAHLGQFDVIAALKELYIYVTKYFDDVMKALESDEHCRRLHLPHKLENVQSTMEGEETSMC
ncbi:plexin-B-like [Pollicipes pollicipes]|uniref:plexin-B-like n=1 Tax=Pollicipes pollicipes TaxID=41117 RepID=UPI0018850617|nr:plexin-B-like [Pollicipes pollicipes]